MGFGPLSLVHPFVVLISVSVPQTLAFFCPKIASYNIQTEVEIISDGHLFLDLTSFMENMKQELLPFV